MFQKMNPESASVSLETRLPACAELQIRFWKPVLQGKSQRQYTESLLITKKNFRAKIQEESLRRNMPNLEANYRGERAPTIDSKIFTPSVHPSSASAARSGCGIMPTTLRPGLQMPATLSSDPFGFAAALISPPGEL